MHHLSAVLDYTLQVVVVGEQLFSHPSRFNIKKNGIWEIRIRSWEKYNVLLFFFGSYAMTDLNDTNGRWNDGLCHNFSQT